MATSLEKPPSSGENLDGDGSHGFKPDAVMDDAKRQLGDMEPDEDELERLVFGSKTSFGENLLKAGGLFENEDVDGADLMTDGDSAGALEDVDDADLFVFDTGIAGVPKSSIAKPATGPREATAEGDVPAWEDSDDERLAVSLADTTLLRKLRTTEAEDLISGAEYSRRLRQQYLRLHPAPAWARQPDDRPTKRRRSSAGSDSDSDQGSDSDSDLAAQPLDSFLRDVNRLAGAGSGLQRRALRPEVIDIQRTREIPDKHKMAVECLSFHPVYPVLLSASTASVMYLHHIAPDAQPVANPLLTSVQAKQVDVRRAEFLRPLGDKIFFAGRRRYFHHWDLPSGVVQKTTQMLGHGLEHKTMERFRMSPCGRYMAIVASTKKGGGVVNFLSVSSMQWIAAARLQSHNGIADLAWWRTGEGITILGKDGLVGEYSIADKAFVGLWQDDGCVGGIVLALGGHHGPAVLGEDRWVVVGSNSGIANIYDRNGLIVPASVPAAIVERPRPARVLEQLVTPITVAAFSPDGQLLAFGSREKKDALRLVHLPSCSVYRNWPTRDTPLGRITAVAFGKDSDMLAVGNDSGKIRLWTIHR